MVQDPILFFPVLMLKRTDWSGRFKILSFCALSEVCVATMPLLGPWCSHAGLYFRALCVPLFPLCFAGFSMPGLP
jgi:hypothetical protein